MTQGDDGGKDGTDGNAEDGVVSGAPETGALPPPPESTPSVPGANIGATSGAPRNPWHADRETPRPRPSTPLSGGPGGGNGRGPDPRNPGPPRPGSPAQMAARLRGLLPPGGHDWGQLALIGLAGLWVLATSFHQIESTEQGIVTTFGKYTSTIGAGVSVTLPWPIQSVDVTDVTSIRRDSIPDGEAEKLMLTSDQNLVDLSYIVRWNIRNLKLYSFQLDDPKGTIREVAEAAMRASVAEVRLNDVMGGSGRAEIEQNVRQRMQAILDAYHSGVLIQGVDIKKADPPDKVVSAFQQVTVAQQDAQKDMSNAQAFAQQVIARAQGDAAAFDKVYAQYKLAPEVTRRRMYYETMERVLSNNDKVIVEGNTTSYLPLPQIRHSGQDDAQASGSPSGGASGAPAGGQ